MSIVMPHWSASRFMLWEQCPQLFKARYIDEQEFEMTEAVAFGQAVHLGLEAHFCGDDPIRAFRAAWKAHVQEYALEVDRNLTRIGMDLIDQVCELGLAGIPERGFSLDTEVELGAPIVGAIDLWGNDGVIYDFKTTRGLWSHARAQTETWQPALYTMARAAEDEAYMGAFEYIVLNRITGQLQRFCRVWTPDDVVKLWDTVWERMRLISNDVQAGRFACHGDHGYCPECGDRWSHEHDCTLERVRARA